MAQAKVIMPTICLSSPYLPTSFGGGEKYFFDVALGCAKLGWQVKIGISRTATAEALSTFQKEYEEFLGVSLADLEFIAAPVLTTGSLLEKHSWTSQFDAFFWVTDGSLFLSGAKWNIAHFQIPFTSPPSVFTKLKLLNWNVKTANSSLTQRTIKKSWGMETVVHWPMVAPLCTQDQIAKLKKEKIIVNVGRFFKQLHAKRQDVLIEGFRQLIDAQPKLMKGWELVLIGGADDMAYIEELKTAAKELPIRILPNADRSEIEKYYKKASMYWHAAGYDINEEEHPERTEHFGITTVEAMSAGCIPIVVLKGGQVEVIGTKLAHLGWHTLAELQEKTVQVIEHPTDHAGWQAAAYTQVEQFSPAQFQQTLAKILPSQI